MHRREREGRTCAALNRITATLQTQGDRDPPRCLTRYGIAHVVAVRGAGPAVLYIDLHLVHEGKSPQASAGSRKRNLRGAIDPSARSRRGSLDSRRTDSQSHDARARSCDTARRQLQEKKNGIR